MHSKLVFGFVFLLLLTSTKLFSINDHDFLKLLKLIQDGEEEVVVDGELLTFEQATKLSNTLLVAHSNFSAFQFINITEHSEGTGVIIGEALKNPNISKLDLSGTFLDSDAMDKISSIFANSSAFHYNTSANCGPGISELILSGAQSSEANWVKFAQALISNQKTRTVNLCMLKDHASNLLCGEGMCVALEKSFSKAKHLVLDLSACGFVDEDKVARLRRSSLRSVTINYDPPPTTAEAADVKSDKLILAKTQEGPNILTLVYSIAAQFLTNQSPAS